MTRHLLDVIDLSADEVSEVLDLAQHDVASLGRPLDGEGVALIFEKPSNRTRHSMEMAVAQLGGHPVYTRGEEVGLDVREPVEDVARILAGYHGMIAARVFDHAVLERMGAAIDGEPGPAAQSAHGVPVVNMLSDRSHPLQAFADALTMRQHLGDLAGRTVAWIGDYNNVARSLGEIAALCAMRVRIACPEGFGPDATEVERLLLLGAVSVDVAGRAVEAAEGADAVHTDTWVSMGQEADKAERIRVFEGFQVDADVMSAAASGAVFMHCLPAYRGLEVAADVIDGPASVVIQQGHNRLHAARAVLAFLARHRSPRSGRGAPA